jgi:outer membrane protein assembly factor BamB
MDGQTVIETIGVGAFVALRATDGTMLWHSQPLQGLAPSAEGALAPPPIAVDGVIYAAVGYDSIAAWDERDGRSLWVSHFAPDLETAQPTNPMYGAGLPVPVAAGSAVYASTGLSVYALRAADGTVLWHLPDAPVNTSYSAPVVAEETVYVADSDGTVVALTADTGAIRWRSPGDANTGAEARPTVVVQGQTMFVASSGDHVRALNIATGAQRWRYLPPPGGPLAPLMVAGSRVYLVSLAYGVYALDAATGQELWGVQLHNGIFDAADSPPDLSRPAVDQGVVVVVAANGGAAWRIADGHELWVAHIPGWEDAAFVDSTAVAAGMVVTAQGGTQATCYNPGKLPHVQGLRDTDGAMLWQVSI